MPKNLLQDVAKNTKPDPFWEGVTLPYNDEDEDFEFVNAVNAAEWFAKKTSDISHLGGLAERLEEEIANLKVHKRRKEAEFAKFRRRVLSKHYAKITKSADKEIQAAFLLSMCEEEGKVDELEKFEKDIEDLTREIEVREPRRDQYYARLKAVKDAGESARQFLDFEKLERRITAGQNGRRV